MKRRWIAAIKRDEGPQFQISKATKVCSKHFVESDFWTSVASGRRLLRDSAVPSVFSFRKSKPPRKPPRERMFNPATKKQRSKECRLPNADSSQLSLHDAEHGSENQPPVLDVLSQQLAAPSEVHENHAPLQEIFLGSEFQIQGQASAVVCGCRDTIAALEMKLAASRENEQKLQQQLDRQEAVSRESVLSLQAQLNAQRSELQACSAASKQTEDLQKELHDVQHKLTAQGKELGLLRDELIQAQRKIESLEKKNAPFGIEKFQESDEDIQFYTGLRSYSHFVRFLKFLDAGEDGENIRRHQGGSGHRNSGRRRKVDVENQLFLVLIKLRLGLFHRHIGDLFNISTSTVSRIFSSWIDFMYLQLMELTIWQSRFAVDAAMPAAFIDKYSTTRVLLDATEIHCDVPSSFVTQSDVYSHYKSGHTFKGLVGVAPSGVLTYVSELFTGSTSDRECVIRSGFLKKSFDPGDSVMADKGFRIEDLLAEKGVELNIPPFLKDGKFTEREAQKTQEIAALRIHVERRIQRIKTYHIFDRSIPISLAPLANQIWTVCAILSNLQPPLLKEDN